MAVLDPRDSAPSSGPAAVEGRGHANTTTPVDPVVAPVPETAAQAQLRRAHVRLQSRLSDLCGPVATAGPKEHVARTLRVFGTTLQRTQEISVHLREGNAALAECIECMDLTSAASWLR